MAGEICDIALLPPLVIGPETAPGAADGSIAVFASGSYGGTKKYNIGSDFDYATQGNTTGIFNGLVAGTYTIYARSGSACVASSLITIPLEHTYGVRFTNRYYDSSDVQDHYWKFEIQKRDYSGSVDEILGKASVTWGQQAGEDPFATVAPSSCTLELTSTSDAQFAELYTNDEREFKVIVYKWDGADWDVWWQGFLLTGQYFEPYDQLTNYTVTVTAADMLENLKDIPFGQGEGGFPQTRIPVMTGILLCLRQTEIYLDVYEGIQLVVDGVTDGFDETSAVELVYFDPSIYNQGDEPESCFDVLSSLLRTFWARVYQSEGRWNIETVTMKAGGTFNVRTRDIHGDETGAGYLETEPRTLIRRSDSVAPRLCFIDRSQGMKISQTFGTVRINYNYGLEEENNLLLSSNFVAVNLATGQLENWEIDLTTAPFIGKQIVTTTGGGESFSSLKLTSSGVGIAATELAIVKSQVVHIEDPGEDYTIRISFEVFLQPFDSLVYTYFDYAIALLDSDLPGDLYVLSTFDSDTGSRGIGVPGAGDMIEGKWNRVYVDEGNQWKTISFDVTVEQSAAIGAGDFQIQLRFGGNPAYDHADVTSLENEDTLNILSTQTFNNRRKLQGSSIYTDTIMLMELEPGDGTETFPDVVPADFGGSNNGVWKFKKAVYDPTLTPILLETWWQSATIRNFQAQYLPNGDQPEEEETVTAILNSKTKQTLDVDLRHGDDPGSNLRLITRGWLSFEDGTPINDWQIRTEDGGLPAKRILQQCADTYRGQYDARRFKLTGSLSTMQVVPSFYTTFWEVRNGKVYIPLSLTVDTKGSRADAELIEVLAGAPIIDEVDEVIDPVEPDEPIDPPDPASGRVHTAAFAAAFN